MFLSNHIYWWFFSFLWFLECSGYLCSTPILRKLNYTRCSIIAPWWSCVDLVVFISTSTWFKTRSRYVQISAYIPSFAACLNHLKWPLFGHTGIVMYILGGIVSLSFKGIGWEVDESICYTTIYEGFNFDGWIVFYASKNGKWHV